jgi:hypothetical protein
MKRSVARDEAVSDEAARDEAVSGEAVSAPSAQAGQRVSQQHPVGNFCARKLVSQGLKAHWIVRPCGMAEAMP